MGTPLDDLVDLVDLEPIEDDIFRGQQPARARTTQRVRLRADGRLPDDPVVHGACSPTPAT